MAHLRDVIFTGLLCMLSAGSAFAEKRAIKPGPEAERFAAVGILQARGDGFCSAALIDQKTVLTAAHCVYSDRTGRLHPPENMRFLAGWRDGITAAQRDVVRITAHRGYDPARSYNEKNIAADIAIVELAEPIEQGAARAFGRLDRVRVGETMSVVSFSGVRSDVASIDDGCLTSERTGNRLLLDCISTSGMSGAPLFVVQNGVAKIAALVSGSMTWSGSSKRQMIALAIERPLRQVLADAAQVRQMELSALPRWATRSTARSVNKPVAVRKVVKAKGSRLPSIGGTSRLSGGEGGRKVVKPPRVTQ